MDDAHDDNTEPAHESGGDHAAGSKSRKLPGKWSFTASRGAMRVSERRPCPVCGGTSNCQISAEHPDARVDGKGARAILCRRRVEAAEGFDITARVAGVDGVVREAGRKREGGRLWEPIDERGNVVRAPVKTAAAMAAEAADDAAADEIKRGLAEREYLRACGGSARAEAGVDHPMVRDYLMARGINPAWLPGGKVPRCLRFDERCPVWYDWERGGGWGSKHPLRVVTRPAREGFAAITSPRDARDIPEPSRAPAMIAAVLGKHDEPRLIRGVHATYLVRGDDGIVRKDVERVDGGRREFAPCDGVAVIGAATDGMSVAAMFPSGVAIAGEGWETTLSAYVACDGWHTGLVCANTTGLKKLGMILRAMPQARQIHTLVVLVDLDKPLDKHGKISRAGQKVGMELLRGSDRAGGREALGAVLPWVSVHLAVMRAKDFPELVRRVKLEPGTTEHGLAAAGKLGCAVSVVDGEMVEDQPIDPEKGVDWNDAIGILRADDPPEVRFEIGRTIMRGAELEGNEARAKAWWAEHPEGLDAAAIAGGGSSSPPAPREDEAPDDGATGAGVAGVGGQSPLAGAGGGGSDGGRGGGAAADNPDDDGQNSLPETDLGRARMFLWQTMAAREGERAGTCTHLRHVDGEFKRWAGNVWKSMRAKGEVMSIRGLVREWMTGKYVWRTRKEADPQSGEKKTIKYKEFVNPSLKAVEAVAKCVLDEVRVETDELRFWMPPDFNPIGELHTGRKPWQRWIDRPVKAGLPDPRDLIALDNCVLDSRALEAGRLETTAHDPRLFNEHVLPFGLPVKDIRAAIENAGGDHAAAIAGIDELANELCPNALDYFNGVFLAEEDPEGSLEQVAELRKLIWYYCTYYTGCKEANIAVMLGPDNAGKGTAMDLIKAVVGEGNFVASTVDEAADKNHITSWVGRRLAVVSEAESGERADLRRCMNFWKRVSGGDGVATRKLYALENPNTVLPTRILVSANEMPDMKDRTGALMSRMIAFAFKESHTGKATYDRGLKERVIAEAPGVFVWALGGGLEVGRLKREGKRVFNQPRAAEGALASYRTYQSDLPEFISQWLEISKDAAATLFSRDMWEAYVVYRRLADDPHPERGGPAILTKAIQTLLWKAGWRGVLDPDRPVLDPRTSEKRRMAVYTHLRLTESAKSQIAASQSKQTTYARDGDEGTIPFGQR